jgi:putative ABC transport system substrate-binding protein
MPCGKHYGYRLLGRREFVRARTIVLSYCACCALNQLRRDTMTQSGLALLLILPVLWGPVAAQAQQTDTVWRIGVLMPERPGALEALAEALREFKYVEGRNIILEPRRAVNAEQMPKLAAELVNLKPHIIVAITGVAAVALKDATKTIPIVMASSGDAVRQGLVASLARPGGNVTGLTIVSPDLTAKRLQILKETAPWATRIGVIGCRSTDPLTTQQWLEVQAAANQMRLHVVPILVGRPEELSQAFEVASREKIDAFMVLDCSSLPTAMVTSLVNRSRQLALYSSPRYVQADGLMSYGQNFEDQYRRTAAFVDKILKGAKPAELPVEQPTKFELIINLKTAKALGLTIPSSILVRADKVIE